jgi:hypothetical protein
MNAFYNMLLKALPKEFLFYVLKYWFEKLQQRLLAIDYADKQVALYKINQAVDKAVELAVKKVSGKTINVSIGDIRAVKRIEEAGLDKILTGAEACFDALKDSLK